MKKLAIILFAVAALLPFRSHAASDTMCYELYQPVCAAQPVECFAAPCYPVYKTYTNTCFMQNDNATLIHSGECTATETGPVKPATSTPPALPATTTPSQPYVPPAGCIAWFDGCNSCGKNGSGAICTLMACVGPAHPGYCTVYASTTISASSTIHSHPQKPPTAAGGSHGSTTIATTTATSSLSASTTAVILPHGFFVSLWHHILNWFRRR